MRQLNIKEKLPLQGVSLVEASAGTGKTFSITKMILQALLSGVGGEDNSNFKVTIEEILVVTFTEAATKELRSRVRTELHKFEKYLTSDKSKPNEEYDAILALSNLDEKDRLISIRMALLNIDQAPIHTIHSFCQRMLTENAFESKIAFGAELLTDTTELIQEIAENFWRKHFVNISEKEKELYSKVKFETILDLTEKFLQYHNVELVNVPVEDLDISKKQLLTIQKELPQWDFDALQKEMLDYFKVNAKNLNKPFGEKYYEETIENSIQNLKNGILDFNEMSIFSKKKISEKLQKKLKDSGFILPDADFFEKVKPISKITDPIRQMSIVYKELYEYTQSEFIRLKVARHILTFDDLINKLYDVLREESVLSVKPLTELIRSKYRIAFVDEFQDTDKQQYYIFKYVFGESADHGFFMIGDPKQSIYKFRGADIYSYLKAKNDANNRYTLLRNYRSEEGMINAVNTIFQFREILHDKLQKASEKDGEASGVSEDQSGINEVAFQENQSETPVTPENVFVYSNTDESEGIDFSPAGLGYNKKKRVLKIDKSPQNLHIWLVSGFNDKFIDYNIAKNISLEITNLMELSDSDKAYLESESGERSPLSLGDIAVLVNTNKQAAKIKHELSKSNIPAVIQRTAKLFDSRQAAEIKLWLKAVIKPTERNIRPLFVTDLLRKRAVDIANLPESEILRITEELAFLKKMCKHDGIFACFLHFTKIFHVMEEALKDANGDRIVTNYFHIIDLLHQHELKAGKNIEKVLAFLEQEMQADSASDEKQEQLESDKKAVRIMTIHKSKGLEFPVVFCPYIWSSSVTKGENDSKVLLFSEDVDGESVKKLDLKADASIFKEHQIGARKETLAEYVRLLYVALTRAANRCYLGIGENKNLGKSVLNYIFTNEPVKFVNILDGNGVGERLQNSADQCIAFIDDVFGAGNGEYSKIVRLERKGAVFSQPRLRDVGAETKLALVSKELKGIVFQNWSVGSFSGLIANVPYTSDAAKDGNGAFGLPRGKNFGTAVHKVFENYYSKGTEIFTDPTLRKYCFEIPLEHEPYFRSSNKIESTKRFKIAEDMFKNVLSANIATVDSTFSLDQIRIKDAKTEFSFYHSINKISPRILKEIFSEFATEQTKEFAKNLEHLGFSMKKGYMYGEIDLLFRKDEKYYILDWKTNHLGANFANYSPAKIEENMCKHLYMLQAHVYSLATHLFLKQQLKDYDYDKNFGGFIYLYTRGVDGEGNGYYFNKPARAFMENMEKRLT
jgi:exodeoxyribonuclease V beta subunit